jgi:hypothetical protein
VGRPSKWNGAPDNHGNWEDILAKYMAGELQLPSQQPGGEQQQPQAASAPSNPPSRVVELKNMLTADDLANEEEYADITEDTREECAQFGELVSIAIPKAGEVGTTKIFLEYKSQQDAAKAIHGLEGRTFDGRRVQADYFDEAKFASKDYS